MDNSLHSILCDIAQQNHQAAVRFCIAALGLIFITVICVTSSLADANQTITVNPIGEHTSGEKINITGTTSIDNCKQIGVEIIPKKYWDEIGAYAKGDSTGKVVFNPVAITSENIHPTGINLVRFNADRTQSQQNMDIPKDHILATGAVVKNGQKEKTWSVMIDKTDDKKPLSPGTYHVNIWDATNQKKNDDNLMPNGWDIVHQKIYPSTGRINLWDAANQRDMQYAELIIK